MCGGFYCSRNSLILLNVMYIVSFFQTFLFNRFSANFIICIAKSISHVTNPQFLYLGCRRIAYWLFRLWKSVHWSSNFAKFNWMWYRSDFISALRAIWCCKTPSSHTVLLHDHPVLPVHCAIRNCLLLPRGHQTSTTNLCRGRLEWSFWWNQVRRSDNIQLLRLQFNDSRRPPNMWRCQQDMLSFWFCCWMCLLAMSSQTWRHYRQRVFRRRLYWTFLQFHWGNCHN